METVVLIIAAIAAIFGLMSGIVAIKTTLDARNVAALYGTLRLQDRVSNTATRTKYNVVKNVLRTMSRILTDLAYCTDSNELNWKLHHIRAASEILDAAVDGDSLGLYDRVLCILSEKDHTDRVALFDIIDEELKHYFALSDKEFPIVKYFRFYEAMYNVFASDASAVDTDIRKEIQDLVAKMQLDFAMVDHEAERERKPKEVTFENILEAQQRIADLIVTDVATCAEDEEVNAGGEEDEIDDQESEQVCGDAVLSDGCLEHEEAEEPPAEETPEAADPDVIVVETDTEEVQG